MILIIIVFFPALIVYVAIKTGLINLFIKPVSTPPQKPERLKVKSKQKIRKT